MNARLARFSIGDIVRHRLFPFRGVIFDVDPQFANSERWYQAIPEKIRPAKDQPFYHLLAESEHDSSYVAYVCEANLVPDDGGPVGHPQAAVMFSGFKDGHYVLRSRISH